MRSEFTPFFHSTSGADIHGVQAGDGPPVLLLHGIPQTHLMWRFVAPVLARDFTVVATDLRGYGASGSVTEHDPRQHSMRELAREQLDAMHALGHERFAVVGHDRGARCAYRMALDHPETVTALSVLDIVPTAEAFDRADDHFASDYWVWSFLAAPSPIPETLIAGGPDLFVDAMLDGWAGAGHHLAADVRNAYRRQFHEPARVSTICDQYRAAATVDREHDEHDRQTGRVITAPTQALWSADGAVGRWYDDPIALWGRWAIDAQGRPLPCGHFLAEEQPDATAEALRTFLASHLVRGTSPAARERRCGGTH